MKVLPVDVWETIRLGLKNLLLHKLRSTLTALGVIFGVCSVVAMLSIGAGASHEAQERIKKLGANNIIITSVKPPQQQTTGQTGILLEYGLTYQDAERIQFNIPGIQVLVPVRRVRKKLWYGARTVSGVVMATVPWFPRTANVRLLAGRFFNTLDMEARRNVCVVSESAARELFPLEHPLGRRIRVGQIAFTVVGVVADRELIGLDSKEKGEELLSPYQVYIPMTTGRERFPERQIQREQGGLRAERVELHEITVRVARYEDVLAVAQVIEATLAPYHPNRDYHIAVPRRLLEEAAATQRIWNIVLGSIAAISLVVGGIGIMNIMLATVTERTREIGIRRALGAKKRAITTQFLVETVVLSGSGGLLGLIVGILVTVGVTRFTSIPTVLTPEVLVLPLAIALAVGVVFGLYPAIQAANMDPIEALRHE